MSMRSALGGRSARARGPQSPGHPRRRDLLASARARIPTRRRARAAGEEAQAQAEKDPEPTKPSLFIFGMGYTGRELARQAAARGWRVCGTTTSGGGGGGTGTADPFDLPEAVEVVQFAPRRDGSDRARGGGAGAGADAAAIEALLPSARGRAALAAATHVLSSVPPLATPLYDPVLAAQLALLRWRATLDAAAAPEDGDGDDRAPDSPHRHPKKPPPPLLWVGYLSSTGVYGDHQGRWVDEDAEPRPASARGVVRLEHERAWEKALFRIAQERDDAVRAARAGMGDAAADRPPATPPPPPAFRVLRLGGIYGPGRSVLEPLLRPAAAGGGGGEEGAQPPPPSSSPPPQRARRRRQRFTSRVHVADAARAALASAAVAASGGGDGFPPLPARVYSVVDDLPAPRSEVEAYALARLREAGVEVASPGGGGGGGGESGERAGAAEGEAAARSGSGASAEAPPLPPPLEEKRVRNARLKAELLGGGPLLYPTYRPAIDALVAAHATASCTK